MANPIEFARLLGLTDRSHNAPISPAEKRLRKVELAQFVRPPLSLPNRRPLASADVRA